MALWSGFRSASLLPNSTDVLRFYCSSSPQNHLFLLARVALAKWIEKSILILSPINFCRGLEYQIQFALKRMRCTGNLIHPSYFSKLLSFLQECKTQAEIEEFYNRFVTCLTAEFNLLKSRNMDEGLHAMNAFFEAQNLPTLVDGASALSQVENCRALIEIDVGLLENEVTNFHGTVSKLQQSVQRHAYYYTEYIQATPQYPDAGVNIMENLQVALTPARNVLHEGREILNLKTKLEDDSQGILKLASSLTEGFKMYVHQFERLHVFTSRSVQTDGSGIEHIRTLGENSIKILQTASSIALSYSNDFGSNLETVSARNYEVILRTGNPEGQSLPITPEAYKSSFETFWRQVNMHVRSVYQTFTLVLDRQPDMIMSQGSKAKPVSFRLFNLNHCQPLPAVCKISVRLVHEAAIINLRDKNTFPDEATAGLIAVEYPVPRSPTNNNEVRQTRKPRSEEPIQHIGRIVHFDVANLQDKKSQLVEVGVRVNKRPLSSGDGAGTGRRPGVTSEKYVLLFVIESFVYNGLEEMQQIWAASMPFTIAAHTSQNESAVMTIAWDEVLASPGRGTDVQNTANWSQIERMLKGTFEVMVGSSLCPAHIEYLRRKASQSVENFPSSISKGDLFKSSKRMSSFWSWFYKAVLVIRKDGFLHEAWQQGYVEGFIGYEDARLLLSSSRVEPGTFILRFSDAEPGSITLVFLAYNREIYRMLPVKAHKKKSVEEFTNELLDKLDVKDKRGSEVFKRVYPDICKKVAFKKFYDAPRTNINNVPAGAGYLNILNMISVPVGTDTELADMHGNQVPPVAESTSMEIDGVPIDPMALRFDDLLEIVYGYDMNQLYF